MPEAACTPRLVEPRVWIRTMPSLGKNLAKKKGKGASVTRKLLNGFYKVRGRCFTTWFSDDEIMKFRDDNPCVFL